VKGAGGYDEQSPLRRLWRTGLVYVKRDDKRGPASAARARSSRCGAGYYASRGDAGCYEDAELDDEDELDDDEEEDDEDDELDDVEEEEDDEVEDDAVRMLVTEPSSAMAYACPSGKTFATAGMAASASNLRTSSLRSMPEPPDRCCDKTIPRGAASLGGVWDVTRDSI
jgi:hypothetical protein